MKTLLNLVLGLILGIICIKCAISSVSALINLAITQCVFSALLAGLFGFVAKRCFAKM